MMETAVVFRAGNTVLEGLLHQLDGERGAIITHPHSLYGGDMHNPVVEAISRVYTESGYTTLRFNFRGVGASSGTFADGRGEQADVLAAIRYLTESGLRSIDLAGYSFGARVLAGMAALPQEVAAQLHVAPPVAFMDYSEVAEIGRLHTVITGEHDEIAPPGIIRGLLGTWNGGAQLKVIKGGDHFFTTTMAALQEVLRQSIG